MAAGRRARAPAIDAAALLPASPGVRAPAIDDAALLPAAPGVRAPAVDAVALLPTAGQRARACCLGAWERARVLLSAAGARRWGGGPGRLRPRGGP